MRIAVNPKSFLTDAPKSDPWYHAPYLCGVCPEDYAYISAPETYRGAMGTPPWRTTWGHCTVCGHSVWLGILGRDWIYGPDLITVLGEELQVQT